MQKNIDAHLKRTHISVMNIAMIYIQLRIGLYKTCGYIQFYEMTLSTKKQDHHAIKIFEHIH